VVEVLVERGGGVWGGGVGEWGGGDRTNSHACTNPRNGWQTLQLLLIDEVRATASSR